MKAIKEFAGWFFNGRMALGAVLGYLMILSLGSIDEALRREGPYVVNYGEDGEFQRSVDRTAFLRHKITNSGIGLGFALLIWVIAAQSARNKVATDLAHVNYLNARIDTLSLVSKRTLAELDEATAEKVSALMRASSEYQIALAKEEDARYAYSAEKRSGGDNY